MAPALAILYAPCIILCNLSSYLDNKTVTEAADSVCSFFSLTNVLEMHVFGCHVMQVQLKPDDWCTRHRPEVSA